MALIGLLIVFSLSLHSLSFDLNDNIKKRSAWLIVLFFGAGITVSQGLKVPLCSELVIQNSGQNLSKSEGNSE